MTGRFVSFEGGEGAGKSTQLRLLAERLTASGVEVVATREPGGTAGAEQIRALLVTGEPDRWTPEAELLLMYAARADHVARLIRPALARGAWVLSDRYADSSYVYQGVAKGLPVAALEAVHAVATGGLWPDLTILLDCPADLGLARTGRRAGAETRFEAMGAAFHDTVRAAFHARAAAEPARFRVIDACGDVAATAEAVWAAVT